MLRSLASYFLGENVQNVELPQPIPDDCCGDEDWVFVDDEDEEDVVVDAILNDVRRMDEMNMSARVLQEHNSKKSNPNSRSFHEKEMMMRNDENKPVEVVAEEHEDENNDEGDVEEEAEENFAWENSLIEHPSVYIASQVQQREEKPSQLRKVGNARRRRRGGNKSSNNAIVGAPLQQQQQQRTPTTTTSTTTTTQSSPPASTAIAAVTAAAAPATPTRHHLGNHNFSQQHQLLQSLDILEVLKASQRQGRQKKKKQCHRNSQVHQQLQNKPQRRSDKQQYTRFSRVNNDRKCC